MRLAEVSIRRPVFAAMLILGLVVLGLISLGRLELKLDPDIDFPFAMVVTQLRGASPETVERDGEIYRPLSYSFIPGRLDDNPFLADTDYRKRLQNLPGALRAQLLHGDFLAGREDDEWQAIPTAWIRAAQERWKADGGAGLAMTAIGVDVAQGGGDKSVLAARHGSWYAPLARKPGAETALRLSA